MRFAAALAAAGLSLIALAAVVLPVGHEALAQPATTAVQVGDYYFCDQSYENGVCETTVNEGDTVEWQFAGSQVHSTTECGGDLDACPEPHLWDSSFMDSGSFPFAFDTPGTYLYRCEVHPDQMRGRVIVLAAAQPSPSPQASPLAATPTPRLEASAVPSGGGAPPEDHGGALAWIAIVGGGALVASAAALAALGLRRRDV